MTSSLSIRDANNDDSDWIIARHGVLYAAEFGFDNSYGPSFADSMTKMLDTADSFRRVLVAEHSGARTGSIAVSSRPNRGAFIEFLLVEPAHRRKGVGEALVGAIIEHARASGRRFIELETLSIFTGARRLYAKLGFALVEKRPDIIRFGRQFDWEFWRMKL